ncbi:segregation/condensation protein A [Sporolactobacillus inulinus]|uniref:Segregation and condensation protein A n=1 Tax=Sporolactobacillus inulinus CASD TaxID=1069536 RepID=A0A0U1QQF4_9BACL|nr:segregation/condensation protein A [Sporolactobacillus inulinus]KLI03033.1 segregation and condensation protein A [Sporolactobacillus inulinus CASD]GEB77117.1 segregation and condensation protein A [Sporolactobacillus inulinus]
MEYKVKIDAFEGPLDLLLHLIKKLEIDIYDIPVAEITDQYLDFIHHMQKLELNIASEYLLMAATLIAMKSKMLLPKTELQSVDDDSYEDPEMTREALMQQLLDYRQYKEAAEALKENEQGRMQLYAKPPSDLTAYENNDLTSIPISGRATVHDLLHAFRRLMLKNKLEKPLNTKIDRQVLPIGQQMNLVMNKLASAKHPLSFQSLFSYPDRTHLIVTFLALLELMKLNAIQCMQNENFDDIMINLGEGADDFETGENSFDY